MTKTVMEGSLATAKAAALCEPDMVVAYPITPQTHIVENLGKLIAQGKLKSKHIEVDSEFSALSACVGGSAAGSRVFTATASQGLALMNEVLFAASGMRLPIVMVVANRALSAPINIWNDWQDSISARDSGWIQLYCETVQEIVDTIIQAYKIAEDKNILLPVMVCMDGFFLTHVVEVLDMPEDVSKYLKKYKPEHAFLDPEKPQTQGPFAFPKPYAELRKDLSDTMDASIDIIKKSHDDYAKLFNRTYGNGLIEEYKTKDKKTIIITMGSLSGNVKEVIDKRDDTGLLRIKSFRPFPKKDILNALKGKETVIILEKNISLGTSCGALFDEIRSIHCNVEDTPKILDYIVGIGGMDCRTDDIENIINQSNTKKDGHIEWLMEK